MLYDLLLALATPIFIYFPKIAQLYDLSIALLDVSESTALLILVSVFCFLLIATLELVLRGYRKLRGKFSKIGAKALGDAPASTGLRFNINAKRIRASISKVLKHARFKK